jgi:hypothetical protein
VHIQRWAIDSHHTQQITSNGKIGSKMNTLNEKNLIFFIQQILNY